MVGIRRGLGSLFFCLASTMGHVGDARACINEVAVQLDPHVAAVAHADRALSEGRPLEAARLAIGTFPALRDATPSRDALRTRALRVMAVATVRLDGDLAVGLGWASSTPEQKKANRDWAVTSLRRIAIWKLDQPESLTDLGEALATRPETRDEALRILELLARAPVMTTPQGWAALARLRAGE